MNIRQLLVDLGDLPYYRKLERELAGMENVLDLGCGSNSPLAKVKKTFYSVGVDIFEPAIKKSRKLKIHDEYKISSVLEADKKFKASSFDAVIALDLIEHLNKADGVKLIKMMSKLAKKKVIIFTPNGYYNQDPYEDNPYQVHRSGWGVDDFNKNGFNRIYGMRGIKLLRGEYATIRFKPWAVWGVVSTISQFVVYNIPRIAHQLLAVKDIN